MLLAWTVLCGLLTPAAFDIECGTWPVGARANVEFEMVMLDGTRVKFDINFLPGSTGATIAGDIAFCLDPPDFNAQKVSRTAVRVSGGKAGPILFLTVRSKVWTPTITRVPGPPGMK